MRTSIVARVTALALLAVSALAATPAADSLFAGADSVVIGRSALGQPLQLHRWGNRSQPRILVLGGIHGDEAPAAEFADSLLQFLKGRDAAVSGRELYVLPAVNPDGLAAGTRQNANGVDLNRNWPSRDFRSDKAGERQYGGKNPLSEPESLALRDLMAKLEPELLVILHTPYNCVNYDGPAADLAARLAKDLELPLRKDIGYPTPGSLGSYYGKELGLPVITLEFPHQPGLWARFGTALVASLGIFQLP